ncbi:hypothetical protein GW17_00002776 [Ensete ventricosum]|nr:hypothetical protein GW17_00002776 [Ensete ventricosum]RZS27126.1 hypothetical protein BHM03_00060595 [Ensete ventricosum]
MFCLPHRYKVCISGAISLGYSVVSILFTCLGCVNEDRFFFNLRPGDSDWIASNALDCGVRWPRCSIWRMRAGDRKASWSEACSYYGKFCDRTKVSLDAALCFVALFLVSSHRPFSKFEAPFGFGFFQRWGGRINRLGM